MYYAASLAEDLLVNYLNEQYGHSGIHAKLVAASITEQGEKILTIETKAPKFIDAECLTGDTLLHFERQSKPGQQCLATMSVAEFHDKWVNGVTKVSKFGKEFKAKHKRVLGGMRLRCYDFESEKYTTTNVVDVWSTGIKGILKVSANGFNIRCSTDHYMLTQRGWVKAKDLDADNDMLVRVSHLGQAVPPEGYLSFNRSIKSQLLRKQGHACLDCGTSIGKSCDVHHIIPVLDDAAKAFDESNCVTLCEACHRARHVNLGQSSLVPRLFAVDSVIADGEEETFDLQVSHPDANFVANGFVVHNCEKHRMMTSSSSSSRAKPFGILDEMYVPFDVRRYERGMQGYEQADWGKRGEFIDTTRKLYVEAINRLIKFKGDIHKQHLNRYVEPWMYQHKVVTSTEWDNFFSLRLAPDVQPEMLELAKMMKRAYDAARFTELEPGEWHLPFELELPDIDIDIDARKQSSSAGCARVSYGVLGSDYTKVRELHSDVVLSNDLLSKIHMTPFEHQATPMKRDSSRGNASLWEEGVTHMDRNNNLWSGNFKGWVQNRQLLQRWN